MRDILTKSRRSNNPVNVVKATFEGLKKMRLPEVEIAKRRQFVEEVKERQRVAAARVEARQAAAAAAAASEQA